ncbi:membrane-bound lytic murein transglycosylase D [Methylomagnum ishizawai]|uniref:Membrane-bound lytic murein transglycosylase D n=1 Tax=Methylomagnum ishizawai TaxID=1760988 RepID=A0A1Y6D099_9GAMM|nr:LysM peptidoglycan-binding domain-containing protein [Methylomagnum ishizawai]SMF93982.1 membrane-bound lytic murein transglycosylase D [Methylomagnum ishizawai]
MTRPKPNAQWLCCASIIVLSLSACSHNGGKLKNGANLTENAQPASTSGEKKSRSSTARTSGKWLRKKDKTVASTGGSSSSTSQYDNLWERLFDLYDLPPIEHEEIDREFSWFLNHPTYIQRVQQRAEPFLYSIVRQVEKHDIPGEIALLPVIESAFQPHVVSPANAAGIWQFIPSTGRMYGLKQSRYYDGRRDVYASTRAAIKYLKKLHKDFNGDWLLAIAAYNCGEGAVGRAVQRNANRGLPTDFWSLDLPQETRTYVPRLLAVSKIFVEADQHGIDLRAIPNQAQYKAVKLNQPLDLALAADAADMSLDQLFALNPGFKRQHTDVSGSYHLFIPADKKTADFKEELERLVQERQTSGGFQVGQQELGSDSAAAVESSPALATLDSVEPEATPVAYTPDPTPVKSRFSARQAAATLAVYQPDGPEPTATPQPVAEPEPPQDGQESDFSKPLSERELTPVSPSSSYRLDSQDSTAPDDAALEEEQREARARAAREERAAAKAREREEREAQKERLARAERESAKEREKEAKARELREKFAHRDEATGKHSAKDADKGRDAHDRRHPGELAAAEDKFRDAGSKKGNYTVQPGETLWAVARKHSVDVGQLAKWNNISEQTQVKAGQNLVVWGKDAGKKLVMASAGIRPSQSIKSYTIKAGDTLFSISRRFNVSVAELRKWNGGSSLDKQIQPGKNITVQNEKD